VARKLACSACATPPLSTAMIAGLILNQELDLKLIFRGRSALCGPNPRSKTRCTNTGAALGPFRDRAAWLVNYAKRFRVGLHIGTAGTENFLVNRSPQMPWPRDGADLLLQVRERHDPENVWTVAHLISQVTTKNTSLEDRLLWKPKGEDYVGHSYQSHCPTDWRRDRR
jgi:hypothetical protein